MVKCNHNIKIHSSLFHKQPTPSGRGSDGKRMGLEKNQVYYFVLKRKNVLETFLEIMLLSLVLSEHL